MPDLAGPFVADHAGTHRGPGTADPAKEPAIGGLGDPPKDLVTDAGSMFIHMKNFDAELLLGIIA